MQWLNSTPGASILLVAFTVLAGCERAEDRTMSSSTVDIDEKGPSGQPIIFWRTEQEDFAGVQALLDAGVDVNIRGFMGMTPAIWSATSSNWTMVRFLADRGADLSITARNGMSVASLARTSRVRADSEQGRALEDVRAILTGRGLF